jgi:hypothetical protein
LVILAAYLAAFVFCGVDVEVPVALRQVAGLRARQGGRAFERALGGIDGSHNSGVLALFGRPMECAAVTGPVSTE